MKKDENISGSKDNKIDKLKGAYKHKTLEQRVAESEKPLEASEEFDFGEPRGREVW